MRENLYLSRHGLWLEDKTIDYTTQTIPLTQITINNGPFVAERSRGTKSPNWRGNDPPGHVKQRNSNLVALCNMSQYVCSFSLAILVPRDHSAANDPLAHGKRAAAVYTREFAKHKRS